MYILNLQSQMTGKIKTLGINFGITKPYVYYRYLFHINLLCISPNNKKNIFVNVH